MAISVMFYGLGPIGAAVARQVASRKGFKIAYAAPSSFAANPKLARSLPYDTLKDFETVALLARTPLVLVVNPDVPAKSVAELVALLKQKPDALSFAHSGPGSSPHLSAELFQAMTEAIKEESVGYLFNIEVTVANEEEAESEAAAPVLVAKGLVETQRNQGLQYSAPTAEGDVEVHGEGGSPIPGGRNQSGQDGGGNRAQLLNFVQCRKNGRRPVADIEEGHISSACCILANLSMELGRGLRWDAEAGKVIGDDEANRRLARAYRSPWTHPTPETV